MRIFASFKHINWSKFVWVLGGISGVWALTVEILPVQYFKIGVFVLAALSFAITYFMRPTVYVPDRSQLPQQDGKP